MDKKREKSVDKTLPMLPQTVKEKVIRDLLAKTPNWQATGPYQIYGQKLHATYKEKAVLFDEHFKRPETQATLLPHPKN